MKARIAKRKSGLLFWTFALCRFSPLRSPRVPLDLYPRLKRAKPSARKNWRLIGRGQGIHWPDLDLDLSAEGIVNTRPDQTLRARTTASRSRAQALLRLVEKADKPMTASAIAELLERAVPPGRLRDVIDHLERQGRVRRTPSRRKASA